MATLKVIRKRISSVKNTQKITKAMKMVSAAKLRRAQTALTQARPYQKQLFQIVSRIAPHLKENASPYLRKDLASNRAELLVYTSDRGLCGGFNSNLLRRVQLFSNLEAKQYSELQIVSLGKKGRDFFKARKIAFQESVLAQSPDQAFDFATALERAKDLLARFVAKEFDVFYLGYNSFKSAISQEVTLRKILPLDLSAISEEEGLLPVIYEPSAAELFDELLPKLIATEIYLAHLESVTSELGARMSAMENATNNAREMISLLTLQYNRARQASITKELMDIVNGAESLK